MINVQPQVIDDYLTDSENKDITITPFYGSLEDINYYTGNVQGAADSMYKMEDNATAGLSAWWVFPDHTDISQTRFDNYVEWGYLQDHTYIVMSFLLKVSGTTSNNNGEWYFVWEDTDGNAISQRVKNDTMLAYTDTVGRVVLSTQIPSNAAFLRGARFTYYETITWSGYSIWEAQLQVNFVNRVNYVPKYSLAPDFSTFDPTAYTGDTINNDNLIYEDFSLTESLCSQNNIKFGLCEAAHCEFSEVGADVQVGEKIKVISSLRSWATSITDDDIFAINWVGSAGSGMQTSGTDLYYWRWVMDTPYSPNWSSYIESLGLASKRLYYQLNLKFVFNNLTGSTPTYFKYRYSAYINGVKWWFTSNNFYNVAPYHDTFHILSVWDSMTRNEGVMEGMGEFGVLFYDANKQVFPQGTNTGEILTYANEMQFRIGNPGHTMPVFTTDDLYYAKGTLDAYLASLDNPSKIPLGVFNVTSVEKEYKHNIIRKKVTAYDNLVTLENNATDWYTRYMFGVDTDNWVSNGFEFARQIFSTYWNYVTETGLDSRENYTETQLAYYEYWNDIKPSHLSNKYLTWQASPSYVRLRYAEFEISNPDTEKLYMVAVNNVTISGTRLSDDYIIRNFLSTSYKEKVDPLSRGVCTNGGVMVWELRSDGTSSGICVNRNDYFMISPNATKITIYVPVYTVDTDYTVINRLIDDVTVYTISEKPELTNGNLRLCYYNYGTKEIFACDSSITGRDVVRSLLEVCGCFFRLDRYKGLPEFVYPTKGGLYPSNTLYPADDLYPRAGTDQLYTMGKYLSVIAENYEVKNYGRIQILKKIKSSDTQSVVEWQYEGDPDAENTYIIDDNIFYCAEEMEYDYDGMPEVADMLAGMWDRIGNLGYTPNTTQALGAPWLECGDRVGLLTFDGGFETFVFRRTLKGIQNLRDTYESEGNELNPAISNFGYSI